MLDREWHQTHRMPKNATLDQRIEWHMAHAANCGCRDMPARIRAEIEKRGLVVLKRSALPPH